MEKELQGRIGIVTGGSSGIGVCHREYPGGSRRDRLCYQSYRGREEGTETQSRGCDSHPRRCHTF